MPDILDVMEKMIKQRQESLEHLPEAGPRRSLPRRNRRDRDHLRLSARAPVGPEAAEAISSMINGGRGRDAQGLGPHHGGAEAALFRADGFSKAGALVKKLLAG